KSPAQSNYAAGCTFKDSFAQGLQQHRSYPVKVMNWGYWGSVGGAADEYHNQTMERMGIGSIEPDEGMACLQALFNSELNQMSVIKMIGGQPIPYVKLSEAFTHGPEIEPTSLPKNLAVLEHIPSQATITMSATVEKEPAVAEEFLREKGIAYF